MHVLFYLLSLLLLLGFDLFDPLKLLIAFCLCLVCACHHLLHLYSELLLNSLNDLILPSLHLIPVIVEPLHHLIPLYLQSPLFFLQCLYVKLLSLCKCDLFKQLFSRLF